MSSFLIRFKSPPLFKGLSLFPNLSNGDAPSDPESLVADLQNRRGLTAFVLIDLNSPKDLAYPAFLRILIKAGFELIHGCTLLDVVCQHRIQGFVWRQSILICLVWLQLSRGRLGQTS